MASFTAARSVFRSASTAQKAASAARFASKSKTSPSASPFRNPLNNNKPLSQSILRCPVEMSFGLESMMPYHTVTASALMTSMLSMSRGSYSRLLEGQDETR